MDKKTTSLIMGLVIFATFTSATVADDEILPDAFVSRNIHLKRCSQAQIKAFKVMHVGYAGLYLERCKQKINIFNKSPKSLRFVYERAIPARAFREAAHEYLKTNLGSEFDRWEPIIDTFNLGYKDIKDGDYYDLIYDPKTGLTLEMNGVQLARLEDPGIGLAYFNIWFGKEPFSEQLKEDLLTPESL